MSRKPKSTREDFEYWLVDMPFALERFLEKLPDEIRPQLDYTPPSLIALEAWILSTYPSSQAMLAADQKLIWDGLARYIGTTFHKAIGGHWDINLDDPDMAYFGLPILVEHRSKLGTDICPSTLATATASRRTGDFLSIVLSNHSRE